MVCACRSSCTIVVKLTFCPRVGRCGAVARPLAARHLLAACSSSDCSRRLGVARPLAPGAHEAFHEAGRTGTPPRVHPAAHLLVFAARKQHVRSVSAAGVEETAGGAVLAAVVQIAALPPFALGHHPAALASAAFSPGCAGLSRL